MVLGLFGVCWVMLKTVVELLACLPGHFRHHWNGHLWMAAPHCLMWRIRRERNNWSFKDTKRTMLDLKLIFFRTLLDWMPVLHRLSLCSVINLIDSCNLHDWFYGPQLCTPCILGGLFFFWYKNCITYLKEKKKPFLSYLCCFYFPHFVFYMARYGFCSYKK